MKTFFYRSYIWMKAHKAFGFLAIALYLIIAGFFAWQIQLEEDITRLIPSGERQEILKKVLRETNFSDKIIVSISSKSNNADPEELVAIAEEFTSRVENELPEYIQNVQGRVPEERVARVYDFVYENLPLFLNTKDYNTIEQRLSEKSIRAQLQADYRSLISPTGFVTKNYILKDPLNLTTLGLEKLQQLQVGDNFKIYNNHLFTKNGENVLLFINPTYPSSETDNNTKFIAGLNKIVEDLNSKYTQAEANYFGGVLYSIANANRIKKDIKLSMGIAISLLLLLLIAFYRKIYIPIILFLPSIIGGITAIAVLFLWKNNISAISLGIGSILLGISLDYALHILTHFRNNKDVKKLYKDVTRPVLMSSFTTAIAFLCLLFLKSEALQDLGIFASISVLVSAFFALLLIPLLYKPNTTKYQSTFLDRIAAVDYSKFRPVLYGIAAFFIVCLFFFNQVSFNSDISRLNYEPSEITNSENKIEKLTGREGKTIYLVAYGATTDQALLRNNKLYNKLRRYKKNGEIKNYSSIGGVVLSTSMQEMRIEEWDSFWTAEKKEKLEADIIQFSGEYGFKPQSFQQFYSQLNKDFSSIYLRDYSESNVLYLDDFISESQDFATVTSTINLTEEKADSFMDNFEEPGVLALDRKEINESFLGNLKNEFNYLILISIVAVFLILLICYQNLELSLLTLLPIGITWIIALGIMAILGISFNILNIIISTFIFGLGLDYSIFMTNAFLKAYQSGKDEFKTYQTSILISVLTTLFGMGALIFAQHPALHSVSVVSIIGILTAVVISFVMQRAIFRKYFLQPVAEGKPPFYLKKFIGFNSNKANSKAEKLYKQKAVLSNYVYKNCYRKIKRKFKLNREKYLKISSFLENDPGKILVVNSSYGLLPVFLSYKINPEEIIGLESNSEHYDIAKNCYRCSQESIHYTEYLEFVSNTFKTLIIEGSVVDKEELKEWIKANAEKVILVNSDFSHRWLLDLNYEIAYRQNNIFYFKKPE